MKEKEEKTNSLISQLFNNKKVKDIQFLYSEDPDSRFLIRNLISREIFSSEKIIKTNTLIDVLGFILLNNSFGADDKESFEVALLINRGLRFIDPIPSLIDNINLDFCSKTLISLSFFRKKMENRTKYHASPPPEYYRNLSKLILNLNELYNISEHHEKWECELNEFFV